MADIIAVNMLGQQLLFSGEQEDLNAVQAMHSKPTARIGGAGIALAFVIGLYITREALSFEVAAALGAGFFVFSQR